MESIKKFNALNGAQVSRQEIERIIDLAKNEEQTEVVYRLSKIVNHPELENHPLEIIQYPSKGLNAAKHSGLFKEALDNCGRLRPGYKFEKGSVIKVAKKPVLKNAQTPKKAANKTIKSKKNTKPVIKKIPKVTDTKKSDSLEYKKPVEYSIFRKGNILKSQYTDLTVLVTENSEKNSNYFKGKVLKMSNDGNVANHKVGVISDFLNSQNMWFPITKKQLIQITKKPKPIKITDITVGKTFLLENKEEINILKLFTENKDETWVEYLRSNKSSENEINTLKLFLNRLNAVEVENRNKINPKPFSEKPKSVSVATAIKDVLSLPKFKGIKPLIATLVYNKFKNETDLYDSELAVNLTSNYEVSILKNDSSLHIFYSINEEITLTEFGLEFIKSVKNRLESLRNQKNNYALFPNLAKPKKKEPKKPLKGIIDNVIGNMAASSVLGEPIEEKKQNAPAGTLAHRLQNKGNEVREYYNIPNKDISDFFGKIEKKTKESVAITITGGQGSMKTRLCFQIMNAFAQNYKVGHASIEEHPESGLYEDKIHQYLNEKALSNISAPEISTIDDLHKLVRENDVIIIDSFSKLQEMQKGIELDKDFRKAYDGKLFIIIYQQTTDGKMRGGSKSQFDGDIICFVQKESDYKENYCYQDKNRYQKTNLEDLKFNIFSGKLLQPATTEVQPVPAIETPVANHQFNFRIA